MVTQKHSYFKQITILKTPIDYGCKVHIFVILKTTSLYFVEDK